KSRSLDKFKQVLEANAGRPGPKWLELDRENGRAAVVALPERDDIDLPVEEQRIVELYSK
ncbi:MAG: 30S ribosomal protein S4, partial [Oscillospiraceae bacterium]|nr:30S ribosomal protein S4 [Oscillospiraceae bacterium]